MRSLSRNMVLLGLWAVIFSGCVSGREGSQKALQRPVPPLSGRPPQTMAILPFENNSVTDAERFSPLSKGLPAMLMTDLNRDGIGLKLIERDKIQALLKEIAFGQSGGVDEAIAVKVGKILGAQGIAIGSYMVLEKNIRIDVRIIQVETSELILAESVLGESEDFMALEQSLANKIAHAMKACLRPREAPSKSGLDAALLFAEGVAALDQGDRDRAEGLFSRCIELDPGYRAQVEGLQGVQR